MRRSSADTSESSERDVTLFDRHAPARILTHLLYFYTVACTGTGSGNFAWEPLRTTTINEPGCPGPNVQWIFAVSAAGYAIASGKYP